MTLTAMAKLEARIEAVDSTLCIGLDSAFERIVGAFAEANTPQLDFNRWVIDQTHSFVAAYKPNMAFYEARGAAGWQELADTLDHLRAVDASIFTICDAKRADIDSTNAGYLAGLFDELGFDGITLHPYLGAQALRPFLARADKACIVLCRTSNPGCRRVPGPACGWTTPVGGRGHPRARRLEQPWQLHARDRCHVPARAAPGP